MGKLSDNWITEHLMDFEYKKYLLLGYLQEVSLHFEEKKLYPDLTDLISQYQNLTLLKKRAEELKGNFKKDLSDIDLENHKLMYNLPPNEEWENEFKQILEFSLPLMGKKLDEGKTIFDFVEKNIAFDHLGILPLNKNQGYFLLNPFESKKVEAYSYHLSSLPYQQKIMYGLHVSYFSDFNVSLSRPIDKIKSDIIYSNPDLPNPAVFYFKARAEFPNEETFLPVAKRILYHMLVA